MKVCPKCGRCYDDEEINCLKDSAELEIVPEASKKMTAEQLKKARTKDWTFLIIGLPIFMLLMYGLYYLFALASGGSM